MPLVCGASYLTLCALWVILGNLHRVLLRSPVGLWPYASLWGSGTHLQKAFTHNYDSIGLLLSAVRWWSCGGLAAITGSSAPRASNCSRAHCSTFFVLCDSTQQPAADYRPARSTSLFVPLKYFTCSTTVVGSEADFFKRAQTHFYFSAGDFFGRGGKLELNERFRFRNRS